MSESLDFRVLGPVEVLRDGVALRVGGTNPRRTLALLIAHRGSVVPVHTFIDALWPVDAPADATGSVQVIISGLRRALGSDAGLIATSPPGYRLIADEPMCDLSRFLQARELGRLAAQAHRPREASSHYHAALAEWRGPAFADLRGAWFADELAVAIEEQRLLTIEERVEADLRSGEHRGLVGELAELTARNPMRETLWAHYMTALYRSGRQADALAAYHVVRTTLRDELGIEPSARLRELHEAILRQDPQAASVDKAEALLSDTITDAPLPPAWLEGADGTRLPLGNGRLRIGRSAENSLVLDDPKVSRLHVSISYGGAGFLIADLGSTNGTRVNGESITTSALADGDVIKVGAAEFVFRVSAY